MHSDCDHGVLDPAVVGHEQQRGPASSIVRAIPCRKQPGGRVREGVRQPVGEQQADRVAPARPQAPRRGVRAGVAEPAGRLEDLLAQGGRELVRAVVRVRHRGPRHPQRPRRSSAASRGCPFTCSAAPASRRSRRGRARRRSPPCGRCAGGSPGRAASDACSTYQRSSSIRSCHGSEARPLICAQPVMPGQRVEPAALALGVAVDLHLHGRPRADQRHLAAQHVDEVRQLVERRAPQPSRRARVMRASPGVDGQAGAHRLGAGDHRAQLVELERPAAQADAALPVDRVAVRLEPDRHRGRRQQPARRRRARGAAHQHVERPLAAGGQVAAASPRALRSVPAGRRAVAQPVVEPGGERGGGEHVVAGEQQRPRRARGPPASAAPSTAACAAAAAT